MNTRLFFTTLGLVLSLTALAEKLTPVDYVSPLVGTDSRHELSTGNTYPAIAMPWGMNFWMPQTAANDDSWAYTYTAPKIRGFRQTHQPSPWISDYGAFSVMPVTGAPRFDDEQRASWFSHKAETARPYYYRVYLADHDVTAEMAPTERAVAMRFTYPATDQAYVVIDAFAGGSHVQILPGQRMIVGYTTQNSGAGPGKAGGVPAGFKNYFVLRFDRPFTYTAVVKDGELDTSSLTATTGHAYAVVGFRTQRGERVGLKAASSFISPEQALLNLSRELADNDDVDRVAARGRDRWNEVLGRVEIDDPDVDHLRTFYSCLYRALLFPRCFSEEDATGRTMHYSPYNGQVLPGYMYTDTGFWDTFRSLFPLLNLLYPDENVKMQQGLVNAWLEGGFLPEWASPGYRDCMVGNNSASVVADAWLRGLRGYDAEKLWQAVVHGANHVHPQIPSVGRCGVDYYNRLGYVPYDVGINENVARTLEYAYDDWCIYQFGKALGKSEKELAPYRRHALNYKNVFDPSTRFMRGRLKDGTFQSPFNPFKWGDAFTEGNSWHWTWCVFHDPEGLISLMGGRDAFNAKMDSVFTVPPIFDDSYYGSVIHEIREMQIMNMGNYAHGNQPIQHMPYLYDWSGQPWKTQYWVREVMDRLYSARPDGYCGDEDNGQTSAWYIFSAMGFYPVCPGTGEYALGTPYFRHMRLHLPGGKTVTISAPDVSSRCRYVSAMTVNGTPYDKNYLTHTLLTAGCDVVFTMSPEPDKRRGTAPDAAPYSFTHELEGRR